MRLIKAISLFISSSALLLCSQANSTIVLIKADGTCSEGPCELIFVSVDETKDKAIERKLHDYSQFYPILREAIVCRTPWAAKTNFYRDDHRGGYLSADAVACGTSKTDAIANATKLCLSEAMKKGASAPTAEECHQPNSGVYFDSGHGATYFELNKDGTTGKQYDYPNYDYINGFQ